MHRTRCIAVGGFKINGPSTKDKGPMSNEKEQDTSTEASLPRPTQAGRIEQCQETIKEAMRCLENNDKQCVTRLIEELIKANCHNGNAVGKEVADEVKDEVHELWLVSDYEFRCGLLKALRDLGISKSWVKGALRMITKMWNKWLRRCGIEWEGRTAKSDVVKVIESILRERFGWSETRMCEELWRFIGVDVNEFRRRGIEPCIWLEGINELSNLRRPYWLGLARSDLIVGEYDYKIRLRLNTTNSIGAVFFPTLLGTIKAPGLDINWKKRAPAAKYAAEPITLSYYVDLGPNEWPWPIKLNANELKRILDGFGDGELAEFVAGLIDGDGTVLYYYDHESKTEIVRVLIAACKTCPKRINLDVLMGVIARRFGIVGSINSNKTANVLVFRGENAVKLLRRIVKYMHHPIRRIRAELILAYYNSKISKDEFTKLYEQTEYEYRGPDVKRNNALEVLIQAAPQTHTHGC